MLTLPQSSSRNARGGSKGERGKEKGAFVLPITPLAPLRRDRERETGDESGEDSVFQKQTRE